MPSHIKLMISVLVAVVAAVAFYIEHQAGAGHVKWVVLTLAALMIFAMWVFPEAKGKKGRKNSG